MEVMIFNYNNNLMNICNINTDFDHLIIYIGEEVTNIDAQGTASTTNNWAFGYDIQIGNIINEHYIKGTLNIQRKILHNSYYYPSKLTAIKRAISMLDIYFSPSFFPLSTLKNLEIYQLYNKFKNSLEISNIINLTSNELYQLNLVTQNINP